MDATHGNLAASQMLAKAAMEEAAAVSDAMVGHHSEVPVAQKGEVVSGAWGRIEWVIWSHEMIAGTKGDTWLYTTYVDVGCI